MLVHPHSEDFPNESFCSKSQVPQFCSSEPSVQSLWKSHTFELSMHCPDALHMNLVLDPHGSWVVTIDLGVVEDCPGCRVEVDTAHPGVKLMSSTAI